MPSAMPKPDRKPDPDFEPDYDTPDPEYDEGSQASYDDSGDPDYDEGAQVEYDADVADPDSGDPAGQEWYARKQK